MDTNLKEARRMPGSEWLKDHPRVLEVVYKAVQRSFMIVYPFLKRFGWFPKIMVPVERVSKGWLFNCQMCGQCILHSTGMTCPMNCPKNLRNGPCGGVRADGHCEVIPDLPCVWVQAWERSRKMTLYGDELRWIQPPVNRKLHNTASWINMAEGIDVDVPRGWRLVEKADG